MSSFGVFYKTEYAVKRGFAASASQWRR